jgi:predicted nucleotidyltransferase
MHNLESFRSDIQALAQKHDLDLVILFGSQARGNTHPKSDIDLGVTSNKPIELSKMLEIIGDFSSLLKREDVEVVDLNQAGFTLLGAVVRDGKMMYEKEDGMFAKYILHVHSLWLEAEWLRDLQKKALLDWVKKYRVSELKN